MQRGHQNSLENQSAFLALLMCAGLKVRASPSVRPSVQAVRLASPSTPAALLLQNNGACSCCCCGPRDRPLRLPRMHLWCCRTRCCCDVRRGCRQCKFSESRGLLSLVTVCMA